MKSLSNSTLSFIRVKYCLLSAILIVVSCNPTDMVEPHKPREGIDFPKTEKIEGGEVKYQYKKDVIVLENTDYSYISKVEADTILYFSKSIPNAIKPTVGTILSSKVINDKTPYGLGNKVINISEIGDTYKCITTSASLNEIFEELVLTANVSLISDDLSGDTFDADGNRCTLIVESLSNENGVTNSQLTKATFGSPKILTIKLDESTNSDIGPYYKGSVSTGVEFTINIDINRNIYECALAIYGDIDATIGINTSWNTYKRIFPKNNSLILFRQSIIVGPIVIRPYAGFELGLDASIEGTVGLNFEKQFGAKFGFINGAWSYENLTNSQESALKFPQLNAKGKIAAVAKLIFSMGLYTNNVSIEINPSVNVGFETDFQLKNENLFRNAPTLDYIITADAEANFNATIFNRNLIKKQKEFVSIELFKRSFPLLPTLVDNSLLINKRENSNPLVFDAEYTLEYGLLIDDNRFLVDALSIRPCFRIYRGAEIITTLFNDQTINESNNKTFRYELPNLQEDIAYTGKPSLKIGNNYYDEDGVPFSSSSPIAAITDIVQTSAEYGYSQFYSPWGHYCDYLYEFYINCYLIGAENCLEWGIYAEESYDIYNPIELKDGQYKMEWTGYSNNDYWLCKFTPYVVLKNGEIKFFETNYYTLRYGGYFEASQSNIVEMQNYSPKNNGIIMTAVSPKIQTSQKALNNSSSL